MGFNDYRLQQLIHIYFVIMNSLVPLDIYASRLIPSFLLYEFKEDGGAARRERAGETSRHYSL